MGAVLAVPSVLSAAIRALAELGVQYCISYSISYIYLTAYKYIYGSRFDLYDFKDDEPEKNGFFVPHEEWQLEKPQTENNDSLEHKTDDAFCFGVNSNSESLIVNVARIPGGQVRCSLVLKLGDGRTFTLPEEHTLQHENNADHTFGSSRLKLQCLVPLRKWRIFFNGVLREHSEDEEAEPKHRHVTFTLIITSSSEVFDFSTDMSKQMLSHSAAVSLEWKKHPIMFMQRLREIFDCYEQPSMILGTYTIEKENEKELYLWGIRGRYMVEQHTKGNIEEIYGNFENGAILHLGILKCSEFDSRIVYGYLMESDGFIYPVDEFHNIPISSSTVEMKLNFLSDLTNHELMVKKPAAKNIKFQKEHSSTTYISFAEMSLDNMPGQGLILKGSIEKMQALKNVSLAKSISAPSACLTVSFDEVMCQNSSLTGGKGSSLGKLSSMPKQESNGKDIPTFEVPRGIVVTTEAYKLFTLGNLGENIEKFQKTVWSNPEQHPKKLCDMIVKEIESAVLPTEVVKSIKASLNSVFQDKLFETKFAIRSSATGEDTDQMSAAGQMETFLGVKTVDEVLLSVKKCWASQFTLQAIEYKRRYGQLLNTPMAVVIQEMVPCEVAGVAFTCDPATGDPSFIILTANWGLGESVVSASSEPDTIILKKDLLGNVSFHSHEIGKKHTKIVMDEHSGTKEVELSEELSQKCCLIEKMSLEVGKIAVKVEELYGSSRDIEWGIVNNKVFLFQARPITSIDRDTDFEIRHMFDTYMRCEKEYFSKANVGEVMPGASTPLSIDILNRVFEVSNKRSFWRWDKGVQPDVPYFQKRLVTAFNHVFFCLIDSFHRMNKEENNMTRSMMISLFGRPIEDRQLILLSLNRHPKLFSRQSHILRLSVIFMMMFTSGIRVRKFLEKIKSYKVAVKPQYSAYQILSRIGYEHSICGLAMTRHMGCTISSSFWNMLMLSFLANNIGDWNNEVFADFAFLLSSCSDVLSADVPSTLEKLGIAIAKCIDPASFKRMTDKEAHDWLLNSNTEASHQFNEFLLKHGHRCLKEFDVYSTTWGDDPVPLVKMLKDLVGTKSKESEVKSSSFSYILSKLHVKLGFKSRLLFRFCLLPNCRRGVREREFSKSTVILTIDKIRKPFHLLADVMVQEGYLPRKEMLFFLCLEEINQLIRTRSPRLVSRAFKRWKCHEEMDKYLFPEIISGIPKPINLSNEVEDVESSDGLVMHGVPVSPGVVKATARVVVHLSEASNIQSGDVLITYSTDIGWSPYFPLLSGVVTELGGLISHGAVVAREYGLPCVVALHGSTRMFKSGDLVVLDGNKGILKRVES